MKFCVHDINIPIFLYRSNESCIFISQNRKNFAFCFVLCSLIRTFANDHRQHAGVTFVGKTITALADYSVHLET